MKWPPLRERRGGGGVSSELINLFMKEFYCLLTTTSQMLKLPNKWRYRRSWRKEKNRRSDLRSRDNMDSTLDAHTVLNHLGREIDCSMFLFLFDLIWTDDVTSELDHSLLSVVLT